MPSDWRGATPQNDETKIKSIEWYVKERFNISFVTQTTEQKKRMTSNYNILVNNKQNRIISYPCHLDHNFFGTQTHTQTLISTSFLDHLKLAFHLQLNSNSWEIGVCTNRTECDTIWSIGPNNGTYSCVEYDREKSIKIAMKKKEMKWHRN